jgi:hypothetical protein
MPECNIISTARMFVPTLIDQLRDSPQHPLLRHALLTHTDFLEEHVRGTHEI